MQAPSPRLNNISNNAFPPIGTFTLESTNTQPNSMFAPQADYFNASSHSNHTNSSHMNGTGGNSSNPSNSSSIFNSNSNSNSNNNGGDPNQATRETGIIEKLLVCFHCFKIMLKHGLVFILNLFSFSLENVFFQHLSSTLTDSFNAVKGRLAYSFTSRNSAETLNI